MKYLITILALLLNTAMYSQIINLLDESFENELPESWYHCSGNWGEFQQWKTSNGYLKESSGPYFGRVLNGFLVPHVDVEGVENPKLELDYALGELNSFTQLSIYYTSSDSCAGIWDEEKGGYSLEDWILIEHFDKTHDISNKDWVPSESDFQTIQIELDTILTDSSIRIGIVSEFKNVWADGVWFINNLRIFGNSTSSIINETLDNKTLNIFPNPSRQTVNIVLGTEQKASRLMIFNAAGQLVYSDQIDGLEYQIDVSTYAKGMYILQCASTDEILTKKFVVD